METLLTSVRCLPSGATTSCICNIISSAPPFAPFDVWRSKTGTRELVWSLPSFLCDLCPRHAIIIIIAKRLFFTTTIILVFGDPQKKNKVKIWFKDFSRRLFVHLVYIPGLSATEFEVHYVGQRGHYFVNYTVASTYRLEVVCSENNVDSSPVFLEVDVMPNHHPVVTNWPSGEPLWSLRRLHCFLQSLH